MENLSTPQKIFLFVLGGIVVIILVVYVFTKEDSTVFAADEVVAVNEVTKNENVVENSIIIHVAGKVAKEGIVKLPATARIYDAIEAAGGLTEEADLSQINLANMLKDGQKIYIPSEEDIETGYIEVSTGQNEYKEVGKIDINTATQTELETISGIGPSTALKIVEYRKENGTFSSIEDIKNVPGIGEAKFNSIKESIIAN